jgi:Helix-turn-helix domain
MYEGSVKYRLQWLEEVATDKRMRGLPLACATLLATRYVNRKNGLAWPSVDRLASELQTDRRNCRRALDRLVDAGWIGRSIGGGRGRSNRYHLKAGPTATLSCTANGGLHDRNGGAGDSKTDVNGGPSAPRTLEVNIPGRNAGVRPRAPGTSASRDKTSMGVLQPKPLRAFPEDWVLNLAQLHDAHRVAGWDQEQAEREFEKFRNWYLEHEVLRKDWHRAWQNWCIKGREIADRDRRQEARTGARSAATGYKKWLDRQKTG